MGFHLCEYCTQVGTPITEAKHLPATSSGDVTLYFADNDLGHAWTMPDMIVHYVRDHGYLPPDAFIWDVLHGHSLVGTYRPAVVVPATKVGYLSGEYPIGQVPSGFFERLTRLMEQAAYRGDRQQTRGIVL